MKTITMEEKITAWIARDKNTDLYIYSNKPHKSDYHPEWNDAEGKYLDFNCGAFPQVKWEDEEPTEVELIIKIK